MRTGFAKATVSAQARPAEDREGGIRHSTARDVPVAAYAPARSRWLDEMHTVGNVTGRPHFFMTAYSVPILSASTGVSKL
jgi:hypothetical protein